MIQIPKGSVHIDIRELNLSINYLGELELLKSHPGPAMTLGLAGKCRENFPLQLGKGIWGCQAGIWGRGKQQGCASPSVPSCVSITTLSQAHLPQLLPSPL